MHINNELKKWLTIHPEIGLAILFGSYAKGMMTKQSDVDLAIELSSGDAIQAKMKLEYITELSLLLNKDIDLVDLRIVGQPLLTQIMKYGRCLVNKQNLFTQLAIRNVNSAEDFLPNIERMLIERHKRLMANG